MIVHAVVSRQNDAAILCEFSDRTLQGNVPQCTAAILEHLRDNPDVLKDGELKILRHKNNSDGNSSENDFFSHFLNACTIAISSADEIDLGLVEEYFFHLWRKDDLFYCCLSDDNDPRDQNVNFAFLQAVSHEFAGKYNKRRVNNANSYSFDKEFKPALRSTMHHYNIHRNDIIRQDNIQIDQLLTKVEDLKYILGRNLILLLERDQNLDSLMNKASQARRDSMVFKRNSVKIRREMEKKSYNMNCLIFVFVTFGIYLLMSCICGFTFDRCTDKKSD